MTVQPRHWACLLALVVLWGSAYLLVEVALRVWQPAQIAALRIVAAAAVLAMAAIAGRQGLPRRPAAWLGFAFIAIVGNCLPFFAISWGQQALESGLAGILAATTPVFTLVLAHWALDDERMQPLQIAACVAGFCGVLLLLGPESLKAAGGSGERLVAQLAVLGGAFCYAAATVGARRLPGGIQPLTTSVGVFLVAGLFMSPLAADGVAALPEASAAALLAMALLGLLCTGVASILYFYLIAETGARFTSLLNYLVPVWAAGLGVAVLGERLGVMAWLALALICSSMWLMRGAAPALPERELGKKKTGPQARPVQSVEKPSD